VFKPIKLKVNESIILKTIHQKDLSRIKDWKNDKKLSELIMSRFQKTTMKDIKEWFEKNTADSNQILLGIYLIDKDVLIGIVRVMFILWEHKEAELGIYIGDKSNRGKGYGTDSFSTIIKYMFSEHKFKKLILKVSLANIPAIKTYMKLGFKKEQKIEKDAVLMVLHNSGEEL